MAKRILLINMSDNEISPCEKCKDNCCTYLELSRQQYDKLLNDTNPNYIDDREFIIDMLVPDGGDDQLIYFKCRWFHPETQKCIAYKDRPLMCRYAVCDAIMPESEIKPPYYHIDED